MKFTPLGIISDIHCARQRWCDKVERPASRSMSEIHSYAEPCPIPLPPAPRQEGRELPHWNSLFQTKAASSCNWIFAGYVGTILTLKNFPATFIAKLLVKNYLLCPRVFGTSLSLSESRLFWTMGTLRPYMYYNCVRFEWFYDHLFSLLLL